MDKRSRVMGMWLAILIGQCAVVAPVLAQGEQSVADKVFASRTQPIELYASGLGTFEKPISTSQPEAQAHPETGSGSVTTRTGQTKRCQGQFSGFALRAT